MPNLDFKKKYKNLYSPSAKSFAMVEVPAFNFLMVDGKGDPNTSKDYQDAVQALYNVSYSLKFAIKKSAGPQYSVPPLEGLWWGEGKDFANQPKSSWIWTMMIAQPDFIRASQVHSAIAEAEKKKPNPALQKLRRRNIKKARPSKSFILAPTAMKALPLRACMISSGNKATSCEANITRSI